MMIFENKKLNNARKISFFGLPLYFLENSGDFRRQKFLGGIVTTERFYTKTSEEKIYKIINIPAFKKTLQNDTCSCYLFNIPVKSFLLSERIYNKYFKNLKIKYDDVYILNSNSGESFLFLAYLCKAVLAKNNSKHPLFAATKKYHIDILKMYLPEANYVYLPDLKIRTQRSIWKTGGHNVFLMFSSNHFDKVKQNIAEKNTGEIHYFKEITNTLGLTEADYQNPSPEISEETTEHAIEKANRHTLNLDNFIIIAPEAKTCSRLPHSLWQKLTAELRQKGFDIFLNITNKENYIQGCKTCALSYSELYALSLKAKAVISLRSGLSEFLLPAGIPNIAIYTSFCDAAGGKNLPAEKTLAAFSMKKLPFVNQGKIIEIKSGDYKNSDEINAVVISNLEQLLLKEESLV